MPLGGAKANLAMMIVFILMAIILVPLAGRWGWKKVEEKNWFDRKRVWKTGLVGLTGFFFSFFFVATLYTAGIYAGTSGSSSGNFELGVPPIDFRFSSKQRALEFLQEYMAPNICTLVAHNAYSSPQENYEINFQQNATVFDLLTKYSARGLELDIHLDSKGQVVLSHGPPHSSKMNFQNPKFPGGKPLLDTFKEIVKFLELSEGEGHFLSLFQAQKFIQDLKNEDGEMVDMQKMYELMRRPPILYLFFEDYVNDVFKVEALLTESGLAKYCSPRGFVPLVASLEKKITSGKVVHCITDAPNTWKAKYFNSNAMLMTNMFPENVDSRNKVPQSICNLDSVRKSEKDENNFEIEKWGIPFTLLHYHPTLSIFKNYGVINSDIKPFYSYCEKNMFGTFSKLKNRRPNFILADHIDKGTLFQNFCKEISDQNLSDFIFGQTERLENIGKMVISVKPLLL